MMNNCLGVQIRFNSTTDLDKELKKVTDALARRGFSWPEIDEAVRRCGLTSGEF